MQTAGWKVRTGWLLAVLWLAGGIAPAAADTIDSKLEVLGQMKHIRVAALKAVNRDGLLNVQATMENTDNTNQRLFYRMKWLDRDGFSVWDDEPWKTLVLYGYQKQNLTVVAPTPRASDFRIELQSPNKENSSAKDKNGEEGAAKGNGD